MFWINKLNHHQAFVQDKQQNKVTTCQFEYCRVVFFFLVGSHVVVVVVVVVIIIITTTTIPPID